MTSIQSGHITLFYLFDVAETTALHGVRALVGRHRTRPPRDEATTAFVRPVPAATPRVCRREASFVVENSGLADEAEACCRQLTAQLAPALNLRRDRPLSED